MISYDRYKDKIAKLAAVKNFVVRFRALFIAAFALILALIGAFLATKGMVTSDFSLSQADILYGDSYEIKPAKALFSSVSYQFAPEGSEEWSAEKPDKAGNYRVRTVTSKAFGVGYGTPLSFEIAPRPTEIAISQNSVVYGDDPSNFTCELVNGDTLSVVGFRFDSFATDISNVCANADSVVITNKAGEDVTYCYALSTPAKQVQLISKKVSLAPKAAEYIYNGAPLTYESLLDEASQNQLAAGDRITVTSQIIAQNGETVAAPENAGTYTVKITDVKIMNGDTDVTALYDWESGLKTASISVARRAITVITASDSKEYDATPLKSEEFTAENLIERHRFIVTESTARTVVGSSKNEFTAFIILDDAYSSVHDVKDNYEVSFETGTLEVTPREITIRTAGAEKAYDGTPLSNEHFTMNPMPVEGHVFAVSRALPQITEVGTLLNDFEVTATDEEGNPVTENYAVGYAYGDLIITEQELKYTAETIEHIYDGTALMSAGTITGGLAEGERVEIDLEASAGQTLAGETDNAPVFRVYRIEDGKETTRNYTPTLQGERGKLVVHKRRVTVHTHTPDEAFEYDGVGHVWLYADIFLEGTEENGLADGHAYSAFIDSTHSISIIYDVGTIENKFAVAFYEGDDPYENEVTENYEVVEYEYGTLTVYKRKLSITTGTKTDVEYDGTPFTYTEGWSADRLAEGHTLVADTTETIASVTDVMAEDVVNEVTYLVRDAFRNDVTKNYDIQPYTYGVINRTPRAVTLATKSASKPYDGKPMQCLEWENVERLLTGQKHEIALDETLKDNFASITYGYDEEGNQLSAENVLYFVVLDGEGKDISYNYALDVSYGILTRSKRAMTVHTLSAQKVYDGVYLHGDDEGEFMTVKPVFDGLVEGELYETDSCTTVINVKYEERDAVPVKNDTVYDYYTSDKTYKTTHNYEITTEAGDLLITPRPLSIRTSTVTREYDGQWLYGTEEGEGEFGTTEITGFAEGQSEEVIASSIAKIRDVLRVEENGAGKVGAIENTTQYKVIITQTGEDTTDNYYIASRVNGNLTITPKALTVTTLSASKTYDAEPLDGSEEGEWENGKPVFSGLIAGETYKANDVFTMTDVLRSEDGEDILTRNNTTTYGFFAQEGDTERETTGNYTVEYVCGTLKVLPREITVTTAGATRPYDGTPLTKRETGDYTADNLVVTEKHTHTLALDMSRESEFGTVTDVMDGSQENVLFVLVKEGERDVTDNYNIGYEYGNLEVTPRAITVTTASAQKEYDGTPLIKRDGFEPSWLFTGHEVVLDASRESEFGTVVNVAEGEVDNTLYFKVQLGGGTEEQNERVNANYNILPPETWGTLKITAKTITVRTEGKSWMYDGETHEWDGKSCDEQDFLDSVLGDTKQKHVLVEDTSQGAFGKVTNVWDNKAKNNVRYYVVYPENYEENGAEDNELINQNYIIEYVYGDLVITERPITITVITAEKTYDGAELYGDKGYGDNKSISFGGEGIVNGETAKPIPDTIISIVDFGTKTNTTRYNIYKGDTLTTSNYNIEWVNGELKINKRKIKLETLTAEKVYDGTPLDGGYGYGENTEPILTGELAGGETYAVKQDEEGNRKATGVVNVLWDGDAIATTKNETEYVILKKDGTTDSTDNYEIEHAYGTLKILQREIKYVTPTAEHEYDGEVFFAHESGYRVDFVNGDTTQEGKGLALSTHKLVPVTDMANPYSTITNVLIEDGEVASIDNEVYYRVVDEKGDDITANYLITGRTWGTLTVTPRRLKLITNTHTWRYADEDFEDDSLYSEKHLVAGSETATDSAFAFVSGHTLETVTKKTVHDVCTNTPNVCTYKVMNGTDDVSYNYELTVVEGKLTVLPRAITITSGSETWVYDGEAHKKLDGFTWGKKGDITGLLDGHTVLVATAEADAPSITHFRENEEENNILTFKIMKGETDVTANYSVTTKYGTIAIEKAEITVVFTPFAPVKYNGSAVTYPEGKNNYVTASSTALQKSDELEVAVFFTKDAVSTGERVTPVLAGTYYAHLDYDNCKVFSGSTETDATDYNITAQPVSLVIEENGITVTTKTDSRVYNGDPYSLPEFTDETVAALAAIGHTIEVDESKEIASVTDVNEGETDNIFSYIIYDANGKDVTTNFQIEEVWGKISVTERTVTVVTASGTHEYDGEAFSYPYWEEDPVGLLASEHGHCLEWDESKATASVLTVYDGEETNTFSVVVKNANGKDISYNYDIQYRTDGKIQITPRQIRVTVNSADKVYDGIKLVEKDATAVHLTKGEEDDKQALLGGDELVANSDEVSIINAYDEGTGINVYSYLIKNGANDVSDNYKIVETIAGDLRIDPLEVEVTLKPLANTVYGDAVSVYPTGAGNYTAVSAWLQPATEQLEVAVYFTLNGEETELGKAGTYNIVLDAENCRIFKSGALVQRGIENYSLTQTAATVTVEKRQVELTIKQIAPATKVYNGEAVDYALAFGENEVCYTARALNAQTGVFAAGEALEVELIMLGESGHTSLLHADKYTVRIDLENCIVVKPGTETEVVSDNYTLTVTSDTASYEITKRPLTITLVGDMREYDGTDYEYAFREPDAANYEVEGLLEGTRLSGNFVFTGDELSSPNEKPRNAGAYSVTFQTEANTWWVNSDRCETTDYEIKTVKDATIIIAKRKISVKIESWDDQYKAEDFSFNDCHYTSTHNGFEDEGFVFGDETGTYSYEFKQNNELIMPRNVGVYNATVSFVGGNLAKNYDITSNVGGTFTVRPREITVVGAHDDFTYTAGIMDEKFFFTSYKTGESTDSAGFLGEDADAFNAAYTVQYNDVTFDHTTAVIHGGQYTVSVRLTVKAEQSVIAGNYTITYKRDEFTVLPRLINATRDSEYTKVYDKVAISTAGWNFFDWVDERGETANGFLLATERANAKPTFVLYGDGEEPISPINAGEYRIRISGFASVDNSGLIERDYKVTGGEEKLTIEKFLLIIKPKDYSDLNTGDDIALPEDSVITMTSNEAGNGVVTCTLPAGDSVTVTGDAVLKTGTKYAQAVYIASYELHGDDGVENNYRVIYKYDTKDVDDAELLKKLGAGMKAFFRGNLTCDTRTVEIKQILKNAKHKTIVTDGSKYNIPLDDVDLQIVAYADRSSSVTVAENKYGLLEGHTAKITAASVRQYPGVYKTWLTVKIYRTEDGKETDVTKGYNILFQDDESSYITVKEISLAFDILADMGTLVNSEGKKLQNGDVVYLPTEGGATPLKLDKDFKITQGKPFGKHQVEFKAVMESGALVGLQPYLYTEHSSGAHLSQETYYDVEGCLLRYSLYFTSGSAEKIYDGSAVTNPSATASWILPGHSIVVQRGTSSQVAVGSVKNTVIYSVVDVNNNDVKSTYVSVTQYNGTLTVKPRPLYLQSTPTAILTYNGKAQSYTDGFTVRANDGVSGLLSTHTITKVSGTEVTLPTGSGVENHITISEIKLKNAPQSATNYINNYEIIYTEAQYGFLNVTKRDVTVTVIGSTFTKEYDGTPITLDISADGILTELGHKLEWSAVSITRPSESREVTFGRETLFVSSTEGEVTQYYNINVIAPGGVTSIQLTVTPRVLVLTSESLTKTYDGLPLVGKASITQGSTASGDTLTVTGSASRTDAGSLPYQLGCIIVTSDGEDITESCYEVACVSGTLQVNQKEITVISANIGALVYGQTPVAPTGAGNYAGLSSQLASGHTLQVSYYYTSDAVGQTRVTPKNVGTYYVWIESYTVNGGNADNYQFSCTPSSFTIGQAALEIKLLQGLSKTYDGEEYLYEYIILESEYLAYAGEQFHATVLFNGATKAIDAGTYTLTLDSWSVSDGNGEVSGNYVVYLTAGSLVIQQRTVTVVLGNITKGYDGEAFEYTDAWYAENLLTGVSLTADVVCTQNGAKVSAVEVGQYGFALENITVTGDVASNYNIVVSGSLTVTE